MANIDNVLYFGCLLSIVLRWAVSLHPYSGSGKPPLFGDYEAQRHWMEITVNIGANDWYRNGTNNDLEYWGLDYPPLTAYHSFVNGKIAQYINQSWVELFTSRGIESYYHKLFMRSSVLISDILIYFTAVIYYWLIVSFPSKPRDKAIAAVITLIYPGLILIDHGHFQYNCVSLGLTILSVAFFSKNRDTYDLLGSVSFSLALNYKQMSLYYAIPIFFYLLGKCFQMPTLMGSIKKLMSIAITVILTFALCWMPFLQSIDSATLVLKRLFPFDRGLYEDKVANFWCVISVVIKLKQIYAKSTLALFSTIATLLTVIPSSIRVFKCPSIKSLKYAMVNSSLAFFLFSFQVHEKSILFVAIPILLLLEEHPLSTLWFLVISTFSLQPLMVRDGLVLPYFSLVIFFVCAFFNVYGDMQLLSPLSSKEKIISVTFISSMIGCVILSLSSLMVPYPQTLPDIHTLLNAIYSCAHFVVFALNFHYLQFENSLKMSHSYTPIIVNNKTLTKIKKKKQT